MFSRIALLRKRLQMVSKTDLTTNEVLLEFFSGSMPRLVLISAWTKN